MAKAFIAMLISLGFLMCRPANRPENKDDVLKVTNTSSKLDATLRDSSSLEPIRVLSEEKDTIVKFSINGLSAEGSEVTAYYSNNTLVEANWNIFGETGKLVIRYSFSKDRSVLVEQRRYEYEKQMSDVKSEKDISLKEHFSYFLNSDGTIRDSISGKKYVNVFSEFKANVPFVLP